MPIVLSKPLQSDVLQYESSHVKLRERAVLCFECAGRSQIDVSTLTESIQQTLYGKASKGVKPRRKMIIETSAP
jgi:hypothetical protein